MKTIFILLLSLYASLSLAQSAADTARAAVTAVETVWAAAEEVYENGVFHKEPGRVCRVFADQANIRSLPLLSAPVIDMLPHNKPVRIIARTDEVNQLQERAAAWYHVAYEGKKGYIWGGNLAIGELLRHDTVCLFGIAGTETKIVECNTVSYLSGGVKLFYKDSLLSSATFDAGDSENLNGSFFELEAAPYLRDVDYVLKATVSGEACGIPTISQYYLVQKEQLLPLPRLESVSDAGIFYHSESIIFPDKVALQNTFVLQVEQGETEDEEYVENPVISEEVKITRYRWDGSAYYELPAEKWDVKK